VISQYLTRLKTLDAYVGRFDVVIVGAGPAGMFAAYELAEAGGLRVALLDGGLRASSRRAPCRPPSRGAPSACPAT
jgi:Uncharacterized FAD-dependent dehydrogenases